MSSSFARLAAALSIAAALVSGCGSSDHSPPSPTCGGVLKNGTCYAVCDDKLDCTDPAHPNQTCVQANAQDPGMCFDRCTDASSCQEGTACNARTNTAGAMVNVCQPRTPSGAVGTSCQAATDCDTDHMVTCVSGTCTAGAGHSCTDASACAPSAPLCTNGVCTALGETNAACSKDSDCDSANGLRCIQSKCVKLGEANDACTKDADCDAGNGLLCISSKCATPGETGATCSRDVECDASKMLKCVSGACGVPCTKAQGDCPAGTQCREGTSGAAVCTASPTIPDGTGQYGTHCPNLTECATGFTCVGSKNDPDAYCTKLDGCTTDADCPAGYWCGQQQQFDSKMHLLVGQSKNACQPRDYCAPCVDDLDCSIRYGQKCVPDANGEKYCALPCDPTTNSCIIGASCVDTGLKDASGAALNACRPDVGVCHTSQPVGCSTCRIDSDCGPNGICMDGSVYGITGQSWCQVPCGPPDANGKKTCPKAPNGEEMVCFDHNLTAYGDETYDGPAITFSAAYQDHCVAPWVTQNLPLYVTTKNGIDTQLDPPHDVCGNGRREGMEECDDGNMVNTDGCSNSCTITAACKFKVDATNSDTMTGLLLQSDGSPVDHITKGCSSFLVEGDIETAGAIHAFKAVIAEGSQAYVDVFTDQLGTCNADLVAEAREGGLTDGKIASMKYPGKIDLSVPCEKLTNSSTSANNAMQTCGGAASLPCGACAGTTGGGSCGVCDDDGGLNDCPRFIAETALYFYQYTVIYTSEEKLFRIYAKDKTATNIHWLMYVSHGDVELGHPAGGEDFPTYPPAPACFY